MALSAGAQEQFPPFGPDSMRSLTVPAQSMNSTAKQSFPTPSATPSPASSRSATPQPPEPSNFAASHQDIPVGLTHQQQLQFLAQRQVAALSAAAAEPYSRPSSSLSQYMAKRKADYSSEDIRFNRLRISKFTVEPQEEFLMLEIDSNNILRRCRDNYINGTKLLNLTQVTKGQRDSLLRKSIERDVETAGPRWLRGIW
jgi:hypothetical protein